MRTVPQIFHGEIKSENLLWGYSDVKALHDQWKLLELLK
jgi:glutaredoxin